MTSSLNSVFLQDALDDLNRHLGPEQAVPMDRFRPNIVVQGVLAWEEDRWRSIRVGPAEQKTAGQGAGAGEVGEVWGQGAWVTARALAGQGSV